MKGLVLVTVLALLVAAPTATAVAAADEPGEDLARCMDDLAACADDGVNAPEAEAPESDNASGGFLDGAGEFFLGVGAAIAAGASDAAAAVGDALVDVGAAVVAALTGLAAALLVLRPESMPVPVFAGVAAGGSAVVAGSSQAGLWTLWRRYGFWLTGLMGLFSRIEKDDLLENERRAEIYELIKQRPGIHLSEISRQLDMAWGSTLHHLRKLREERIVQTKKIAHHKCYFLNGSGYSDAQMRVMSLLKNDTLADVAAAIEAHPDSSLKDLSEKIGISAPLAAHHVKTLEKAGVIQKERAGKAVKIRATDLVPRGFVQSLHPHACAVEGAVGFA